MLINEKGAKKLGYTKEELPGKNWIDLFISDEDKEKCNEFFDVILSEKAELTQVVEYNNIIGKTCLKEFLLGTILY